MIMNKWITTTFLALSSIALAEGLGSQTWYERDQLLGDVGGARLTLEASGITPFAYYDSIVGANVSGGLRRDEQFAGQFYAGTDLNLEELLGWRHATMKISMVTRHGNTVSDAVGGIYDPMTIYGGQVTYLYQLAIEKSITDEWAVKLGRVSADNDFAKSPLYGYSLSTSINGPIRATLLENVITSFPYAVWGGRVKYNPSEQHQFQLGVYQIGDSMWDFTKHGVDFSICGDDGVSVLSQYDWTPQNIEFPVRAFIGAVNSFHDFRDFDGIGTTDYFLRTYAHADVEVAEGRKLFAMATYSSHDDVARTPVQVSCGFNGKGIIPGRENDHTMLFATYGRLSDDYADSIRNNLDFESVYELGHRLQLKPAFFVQPSIQYIQKPGGTGKIGDAVVLGAWIGATF